ncbi:MAG: ParB/RepB/Spo0J family partition protein, partial [Patescibacteria group bacterium]
GILDVRQGSSVLEIPLSLIHRFDGQPRTYFDPEKLQALAGSIREIGQQDPGLVRRIKKDGKDEFQLIDGERRFIACGMVRKKYFRATVEECDITPEEQFIKSLAMNFGHAEHTSMEKARAVKRVWDILSAKGAKNDSEIIQKIAHVCSSSVTFVRQHLGLLRLCPDVQKYVESGKIHFQVAIALTGLKQDAQLGIASHIIIKQMDHNEALRHVREQRIKNKEILAPGARRRNPCDNYAIFKTFLKLLSKSSSGMLDMNFNTFKIMFERRSREDILDAIKVIKLTIERLKGIENALNDVGQKRLDEISQMMHGEKKAQAV